MKDSLQNERGHNNYILYINILMLFIQFILFIVLHSHNIRLIENIIKRMLECKMA